MASTSSINSSSSGSQAPNPPPRTHSRPNQPPPPPPLPSVPPVPPTRDSSINISKAAINVNNKSSSIPTAGAQPLTSLNKSDLPSDGTRFLNQFESMFRPLDELPPPDPFVNKTKSYPSQRAQQKQQQQQQQQSVAPNIQT